MTSVADTKRDIIRQRERSIQLMLSRREDLTPELRGVLRAMISGLRMMRRTFGVS